MTLDPLSEVVSLLEPTAPFSKQVIASDPWAVRRAEVRRPFYLVALQGSCRLRIEAHGQTDMVTLDQGDFVLIPAAHAFAASSVDRTPPGPHEPVQSPIVPHDGGARVGDPRAPVTVRLQVGYCIFGSADAALLVSLLPRWLHVRQDARLARLAELVDEEYRTERPAREVIMARLLEVLLIEAFRSASTMQASAGLARGLADRRLSQALLALHREPQARWTVEGLARAAAMSRSAFHDRFCREVGMAPMEYVLAWRMALARRLLCEGRLRLGEIAERLGYGSLSTFGEAFKRHAGISPGRYARQSRDAVASA